MAIELNFDGRSLQELKAQLKELKNDMAAATDPANQEALAKAVGQTRDRMNDLNEQAKIFTAGSKFESVSNSLGDIGGKIASLDFEGANESAGRLVNLTKNLKFGDAVKGVKDLGSTFLQLGKALLTNPLFLLVAVIVAIVAAIIKLMQKIGLLKVIMDALGKVFGWITDLIDGMIQGLKNFTDWLGWTDNAAIDSAQKQADAAEKTAKAYEDKSASVVQGYDQEIRMNELSGKSTEKAEKKKAYWIMETAKQRAIADGQALLAAKMKGEMDEEEIKALEEKYRKSKDAYGKAVDDVKYTNAKIKKENDDARAKEQADADKSAEDAANKAKAANDKAIAARKEYNAMRLAVDRQLEDLGIEAMDDGIEKELAANKLKYDRLIEDTRKNAKLLADEKKALTQIYEQLQFDNAKEIQKKQDDELAAALKTANENRAAIKAEEEQKETDRLKAVADLRFETLKSEDEKELQAIRDKYAAKLLLAQGDAQLTLALQAQMQAEIDAAKKKSDDEELDRKKKNAMIALDLTKSSLQGISDLVGAFAGKSKAAQKKAFETQKKLNIVMATIDTIKGAVAAFTGMASIPIVGVALGAIAAAGVVASGIANIKKISSTTFDGGGAGGAASVSTGSAAASATSAAVTPSVSLFGNSQNLNDVGASGSVTANQNQPQPTMTVKAVVSESDIVNTGQRLSSIRQNAEL